MSSISGIRSTVLDHPDIEVRFNYPLLRTFANLFTFNGRSIVVLGNLNSELISKGENNGRS